MKKITHREVKEHVKMYTNTEVTKEEIKDRAKKLDMSHSQYLNYCVKLELNSVVDIDLLLEDDICRLATIDDLIKN